jgi:hypothetical protein
VYERHDPTSHALHRVVRENLETFYAAIEQGWESALPDFVRAELSGYLECSVLERGFAHLACKDCGLPRLVAYCSSIGMCGWMNSSWIEWYIDENRSTVWVDGAAPQLGTSPRSGDCRSGEDAAVITSAEPAEQRRPL